MIRFHRRGTFDEAILSAVAHEYPLPRRFEPGDVVLDLGCHIGAFAVRAAGRGARVLGYEVSRENYALARMNTARLPAVEVRWGAVWRSDVPAGTLRFTPHPDGENTGGGSVLFLDEAAHRRFAALAPGGSGAPRKPPSLAAHEVPAVPLDGVLRELGRVRLLKLDVEGAELPILLTARKLGRVDEIVGELHELSAEQIALLPPAARVGDGPYDRDRLGAVLGAAGFAVRFSAGGEGTILFTARR